MTTPVSVSVAGTVLLMGSLLLSQRCRGLRQTIKWQWQALSAGVAVSYVFVSVIPDLEEHRPTITASAAGSILDSEKRVYLFALAGFVAFVGLRRLRVRVSADTRGSPRSKVTFWIEITGYSLYALVISYLLVRRESSTLVSMGLFVFAMGLHLFMVDGQLVQQLGSSYDRWGRTLLMLGMVLGCGLGLVDFLSASFTSRLFAFVLGGAVVLAAHEELPADEGRFGWFLGGAFCYAIVLMLV